MYIHIIYMIYIISVMEYIIHVSKNQIDSNF